MRNVRLLGTPVLTFINQTIGGTSFVGVEVKTMTGDLNDHPAALLRPQFECAHIHGQAYWLYVVAHASDMAHTRVLWVQGSVGLTPSITISATLLLASRLVYRSLMRASSSCSSPVAT
jgi:hypothetical protein